MMLCDNEVDDRLWDGAHDDGWRIVPRADAEGCARGTIRYTYVAPSGEIGQENGTLNYKLTNGVRFCF